MMLNAQVLREQVLKEREENEVLRDRIRRLEDQGAPDSSSCNNGGPAALASDRVKRENEGK